ncbi:MAG TPA: arylesterase, partial [Thiomicrospira sp.]|nr:arylesterase [Thiomicrospira sp.]
MSNQIKKNTIPGLVTWLLSIIIVALLLTSCSRAKLPALQSEDVIVAFGDSLTAGYGVTKNQSYPAVLANLTRHKVINAGISGETTAQGLARFQSVLEEHNPGLVILLEGGNDVLQKVPVGVIYSNLKRMLQIAKKKGVPVLLIGVPEKKLFGSSLDIYADLAEEFDIPLEEDI